MLPEIKKILLALDLSDQSKEVLRYAISQAQKYKGSIFIIHVVEPLTSLAKAFLELYLGDKYPELEKKEKGIILKRIEESVRKFCEEEFTASSYSLNDLVEKIEIREGLPHEEILSYSEEVKPDLIIIGHGTRKYKGQLLGSIARKLVNLSSVPLLIVK